MAALGWGRALARLAASLLLVAAVGAVNWNPNCINRPVGFGKFTSGGKGGKTVTPRNTRELANYLRDRNPLIINLDRDYNFMGSEGKKSARGCFFLTCGKGYQYSLDQSGTCNGRKMTTVSYDYAGKYPLLVSSRKTIMSNNGKGRIRGKGLMIKNANNVIIRDITISDINPQTIWGGDAISLNNVWNVWIHKVTTRNIGRQHLVTYQAPNKGVTVSSCFFDGNTPYSAYCNGMHYWTWLFWGTQDEITLINNRIAATSGRSPHAGGWAGSRNFIHIVGNQFDRNSHVSIEPYQGASLLVEGNVFQSCKNVINPSAKGGQCYFPVSGGDAGRCRGPLGQNCLPNKVSGSSTPRRLDWGVLSSFSKLNKGVINEARSAVCLR